MFVIVGLGNPGSQYDNTRHNIGFMLLNQIAAEAGVTFAQKRFHALTAKAQWHGLDVFLLQPQSYMNLSGKSVRDALQFFKIPPEHLVVVCDDLDQEPGAVRVRLGGGHGGHNGLHDILNQTGISNFYRLKIGIGKPLHKSATSNWVLGKFTASELNYLEQNSFPQAKDKLLHILQHNPVK